MVTQNDGHQEPPEQSAAANNQDVGEAKPACTPVHNPDLPVFYHPRRVGRPQRYADQGDLSIHLGRYGTSGARRTVLSCWLLTVVCIVLVFIDPLSLGWGVWTAATVAMAITAGTVAHMLRKREQVFRRREQDLRLLRERRRRDRQNWIFPSDLDASSQPLLGRAQQAIHTILGSRVRAAGMLEQSVDEGTLRRHEWEVACALCDIKRLRSRSSRNVPDKPAGPLTAEVLNAHQHYIALAQGATAARVGALERYASQITAADNADRDWREAVKQSELNDQYLDLVARTARDEHAISELDNLTGQVAAAAQARQDRLREADLAAEVLALPSAQARSSPIHPPIS